MVALYTLIIPDGWIAWIERHARRLAAPRLRQLARALRRRRDGLVLWLTLAARPGLWLATLAALAVGTYSLTQRQFDEATAVAIGALVLSVVDIGAARLRTPGRRARILGLAAAHLVAALAIAAVDNHSETTFDYYKYWGGASRRLGDTDGAREAYTRLTTDVRPEWGSAHYHLANLARREGRADDAIAGYERAQRLSPTDYRSFLAAAELHNAAGGQAETLAAARRALQLAPNQAVRQRAQALIQRWTGR
jgi:tetratricopeptide (TPR) repeat protein